jgi:hypothetical protein
MPVKGTPAKRASKAAPPAAVTRAAARTTAAHLSDPAVIAAQERAQARLAETRASVVASTGGKIQSDGSVVLS